MTDKKLTDEEIIKNLKFCEDCSANINIDIIDLINRQKLELENLKVENQSLRSAANSLKMHYEETQAEIERLKENRDELWEIHCRDTERCLERIDEIDTLKEELKTAKSEAYKEFAERLKEKFVIADCIVTIDNNDIDSLVKEMVGENNDL